MGLIRLLYFSENAMDTMAGSLLSGLQSILSSSNRNNAAADITGALVFDDNWFLQALEGDRSKVWDTLRRIEGDDRHAGIVVVDSRRVDCRLFGNWWMGLARRNAHTVGIFEPYLKNGFLQPQTMTSDDMLRLMTELTRFGLARKLASAAA